MWWSGEICLLRIPDKYPKQDGVPPIGERIEVEVSEIVFMPGVVVRSSKSSSTSQRMVLIDDEKSQVDFNETRWRWCH